MTYDDIKAVADSAASVKDIETTLTVDGGLTVVDYTLYKEAGR